MKYDIHHRWSGNVKFTAEIDCAEDTPESVKRGLAVKWAMRHDADLTLANLAVANLTRADLADANLTRANLAVANLTRADLSGADLTGANLTGADLTDAYLTGADLTGANLTGADLTDANLTGADLTDANLTGANLTDAYLTRANLFGTNLVDANLDGVLGNMKEVKSAQFETWPITLTQPPDGEPVLQIGCQRHPLSRWEKSDPRWIAAMDGGATEWWAKHRDLVLAFAKASPAVPYGEAQS